MKIPAFWKLHAGILIASSCSIMTWIALLLSIRPRNFQSATLNFFSHLARLFGAPFGVRRWHDATLGREMRILDLKHEVNELLSQSGQQPRYPSAKSDDPQEK